MGDWKKNGKKSMNPVMQYKTSVPKQHEPPSGRSQAASQDHTPEVEGARPLPWEPEAVKKLIEDAEHLRNLPSGKDIQVVALRKFREVAKMWSLKDQEAAKLLDMPISEWKLAKKDHSIPLTNEQLCRLSALFGIYEALKIYLSEPLSSTWITRENSGSDFKGRRPVDELIEGGLPSMLRERQNLTAMCVGN